MYIMYGNASNITPFLHSRHYGHLHGMKSPPPAGGGGGGTCKLSRKTK